MRIAIVFLLFIASILTQFEPFEAIAIGPQTRRDTIALRERNRAFAEFERRSLSIPKYRVKCNFYYAEEILYTRYRIKANMYVFESFCGTGMEETWFAESCYDAVIDSLMYAEFGRDIYQRIGVSGDSLQKLYPDRYPNDDDQLLPHEQVYNSDSVYSTLKKHVQYPSSAKRDTVQGIVYLSVEYDSLGNVTGSSVIKSVRSDLDSAAMAGVLHIGRVSPDFRWGRCQPGKFILPVRFSLK